MNEAISNLARAVAIAVLAIMSCHDGSEVDQDRQPEASAPKDTVAPTWPGSSHARLANAGRSHASFEWTPAADDQGVAHYRLFRDGQQIAKVHGTSYMVTLLEPNHTYRFELQAVDAAGNASVDSLSLDVTTAGSVRQWPKALGRGTP